MLNLTTKGKYGLQAVLDLAQFYRQKIVQISDISERCQIPRTYLEQLFSLLRRSGIVTSNRGQYGGYKLAKHPAEITVWEVLLALEGDRSSTHLYTKDDAILELFIQTEEAIKHQLSQSLESLLQRQTELKEKTHLTFYI